MRKVLLFASVLLLVGCEPSASTFRPQVLPDELKDCQFYSVYPTGMSSEIVITRCPNSTTSTSYTTNCGKNCSKRHNNIVIDGVEYAPTDDIPQ